MRWPARPTHDPAAGQSCWEPCGRRRLGNLGGRSTAARTDTDGAAWLPRLRTVDHERGAATGWGGGADWPRDLSDALRARGVAHFFRRTGARPCRGYRRALPLYSRSGHAASAAAGTTMANHDGGPLRRELAAAAGQRRMTGDPAVMRKALGCSVQPGHQTGVSRCLRGNTRRAADLAWRWNGPPWP